MSRKAFEKIKAGLEDALEIANRDEGALRRVKLFNFTKPRRTFGKLESEQNRLHGAFIKPDGDAA